MRGVVRLSAGISLAGVAVATAELAGLAKYAGRRLLFAHPIEDVVPRLVVDCVLRREFGEDHLPDALFVCSDGFVGQLAARILRKMGREDITLTSQMGARRIAELRRIARESRPICIVSNGLGGGYAPQHDGIHPRLWAFARSRNAVVVPIAVSCSRALRVPWPGRLVIPAPYSRIAVAVGPAVDARRAGLQDQSVLEESHRGALRQAIGLLSGGE